jgi:hypothetical protein
MVDAPIASTFVSEVAKIGFADAVDSAESLVGRTLDCGSAKLTVREHIGEGLAGAAWFSGVLRTGSPILPSTRVDIVITPWSAGRVEIGIRPLGRMGNPSSLRTSRFFNAAWTVMPALLDSLTVGVPAHLTAQVPAAA